MRMENPSKGASLANWNPNDIQNQFQRAVNNNWIAAFRKAAADYHFPAEVLMGIASRETNMQSIVGDGGHGYGMMQIDDRSFPDWCHSGAWRDVGACIQKGALVLDSKREQIRSGQGKTLSIGGESFQGKSNLSDDDLLRMAISAYNCGLWAYYNFSTDRDIDRFSTGHDYSADTLKRVALFRQKLATIP